jgi:hypothetical protein|tara:strand:+ start:2496 stop:2741 length:246 start_codon:yes stop_codon:yes gene_type:complete
MEWIIVLLLATSSPLDENLIYITHANDEPTKFTSQVQCRLHVVANISNLLAHADELAPDQQVTRILCVNEDALEQMKGTGV